MDIKKMFELYTGLYAVQLTTFSSSFSHTNYRITSNLAEDYIMSVPLPKVDFKELFFKEYNYVKLAIQSKYDINIVFFDRDSGIKITKFYGDVVSQKDIVSNYIYFIKALKSFHSANYSNSNIEEFSPIDLYNYIRSRVDTINLDKEIENNIIKNAQEVYNACPKMVLCHNNLSLHNIIKNDNNKYSFMGTQLVSISDPLYDLANFFFKSKITNKPIIEKFLKRYFGNSYDESYYEKTKTYLVMAQLIYAVWNYYLYSITEADYQKQKAEKLFSQLKEIKFE